MNRVSFVQCGKQNMKFELTSGTNYHEEKGVDKSARGKYHELRENQRHQLCRDAFLNLKRSEYRLLCASRTYSVAQIEATLAYTYPRRELATNLEPFSASAAFCDRATRPADTSTPTTAADDSRSGRHSTPAVLSSHVERASAPAQTASSIGLFFFF